MDAVVAALAIAVISSASAIVVGLVGAWLAKRKGLPSINAEVEQRMQVLADTLRTDLDEERSKRVAGEERLQRKVTELEACRTELFDVKRDLWITKDELLQLYRSTGQKPPQRLTDHGGG